MSKELKPFITPEKLGLEKGKPNRVECCGSGDLQCDDCPERIKPVIKKQLRQKYDNTEQIQALREALRPIAAAYPDDPGTSDLDDEQPVRITLGDVRRAWKALAKATA